MNLVDSINYAYLCNQLTNLVGAGNNCPFPVMSPTISSIQCNTVQLPSAIINTPYSAIANLAYTGGNAVAYTTGTVFSSTGVLGLTATLQAGTLSSGNGNLVYVISGMPSSLGTANFTITFSGQSCSFTLTVNDVTPPPVTPVISTMLCDSVHVNFSSTPFINTPFTGTATIPYTGGNGESYPLGNTIASTGVLGLTATLQAGTLSSGNGNLVYVISGTPSSLDTAYFNISFGGQTCHFGLNVAENSFGFTIHPNPAKDIIKIKFISPNTQAYYVWLYDAVGRTVLMLPQPDLSNGINISNLPNGVYLIKIMDAENKQVLTKKFVKGE